ncbi:hypothetical protein SDC9_127977 [bioreactor metagenome]|uniref:Uncharacterized protein n=1 Tax=bioreactor metagenome TaxID=1076179 RepID=A0A645CUW0_9ZZZZ
MHIRFQFDGAGQVAPHIENQCAASLFVDVIDSLLNRGGV